MRNRSVWNLLKFVLAFVLAFVLVLSLFGCAIGGKDPDSGSTEAGESANPSEEPSESGDPEETLSEDTKDGDPDTDESGSEAGRENPEETDTSENPEETGSQETSKETSETGTFGGKKMALWIAELNARTAENADTAMVRDLTNPFSLKVGELRTLLESKTMPEHLYLNGETASETLLKQFMERQNIAALSGKPGSGNVALRYGILVHNTDVRLFPTTSRYTDELSDRAFDYFQDTKLYYGSGVIVVHQSADTRWSYVFGEYYKGWVETENIAFCNYDDFVAFLSPESFAISCEMTTEYEKPWHRPGVILPLAAREGDIFAVTLPERDENGNLTLKNMPVGGEFGGVYHEGFFDYSLEEIGRLMTETLGMRYGWGDTGNGFDCSAMIGMVYRMFGIFMPRDTGIFKYSGATVLDVRDYSAGEKFAYLKEKGGGIVLMNGHVMYSLGEVMADGKITYPVIHNTTGYRPSEGAEPERPFKSVETDLYRMFYIEGGRVIDSIRTIITFDAPET